MSFVSYLLCPGSTGSRHLYRQYNSEVNKLFQSPTTSDPFYLPHVPSSPESFETLRTRSGWYMSAAFYNCNPEETRPITKEWCEYRNAQWSNTGQTISIRNRPEQWSHLRLRHYGAHRPDLPVPTKSCLDAGHRYSKGATD